MLLKRGEEQHCGGLWSFPGGKIEACETPKSAAIRELREETGLMGSNWKALGLHSFTYPDRQLHFSLFSCLCENSGGTYFESEYQWVKPDKLAELPMPEANKALIEILLEAI